MKRRSPGIISRLSYKQLFDWSCIPGNYNFEASNFHWEHSPVLLPQAMRKQNQKLCQRHLRRSSALCHDTVDLESLRGRTKLYQVYCDVLPQMWGRICEQWAILPSMWNLKETRTEKCVTQCVRWGICHWTLLWKRISLWYYCSVFRKRSDEGPSISRLIISQTSCSEWTSFLLLNPNSRNLLLGVLKFTEIPWYFF